MRHLRLVAPAETAVDRPAADEDHQAGARMLDRRSADDVATPDGVPLLYVPASLMLALAGRCSCVACCTAYAEHRPEPHDPRRYDDRPRLRAI
jgi:hypothetical protein